MSQPKYIVIGAAILDILARPVDASVFETGSLPAGTITMHTGGDAMNEARVLADLGADVSLVSKVGTDPAGDLVLSACKDLHVDTTYIRRDAAIHTGTNIVLVDQKGERSFITCPDSTLRKFFPKDVPDAALKGGDILSFASIFVSPHFGNRELADLFSRAREAGLTVCADMTKRKGRPSRICGNAFPIWTTCFPTMRRQPSLPGRRTLTGSGTPSSPAAQGTSSSRQGQRAATCVQRTSASGPRLTSRHDVSTPPAPETPSPAVSSTPWDRDFPWRTAPASPMQGLPCASNRQELWGQARIYRRS